MNVLCIEKFQSLEKVFSVMMIDRQPALKYFVLKYYATKIENHISNGLRSVHNVENQLRKVLTNIVSCEHDGFPQLGLPKRVLIQCLIEA